MFRQIVTIFLLLAISAQVFNRALIVLDYYTNTASFAKNCENKARPVMHCSGKCQMMKKQKEAEKKEQQAPDRNGDQNIVVSSKSFFTTISLAKTNTVQSFSGFYTNSFPKGIPSSIFHPPGLA